MPERPRPVPGPPADPPPPVRRPRDLPRAESVYWNRWATLATELGTLTSQSVPGFRLLCETAVKVDRIERQIDEDGWVIMDDINRKAHPLLVTWRALRMRVEQLQARYRIAADGRPAAPTGAGTSAQPRANPWQGIAR